MRTPEAASTAAPARRVLLVDDNADSCALLEMLLEAAGWRVEAVHDAAAALAAVDGAAVAPCAAILDLGLPDMSGAQLVRELRGRAALSDCLFVCLSGRSPEEIEWRAAGFHHFVRKPASFAELEAVLDGAGARAPLG